MALYEIRRNKYPVIGPCGWCTHIGTIAAHVKFKLEFEEHGSVTVDICSDCLETQEPEFDSLCLIRC